VAKNRIDSHTPRLNPKPEGVYFLWKRPAEGIAMKGWIAFLIVLIGIFCLVQLAKPTTPPEVKLSTEPAVTPFTLPECQPAPAVTIKVQRTGQYGAELIATGLQPGEIPYVYYGALGAGFTGYPVNEKGEFFADLNGSEYDVDILKPPEGQTSAIWEFRLVHERGVECARITLP
jgi:hypothetical protein